MAGSKDSGSKRSTRPYQLAAMDLRAAKLDDELHDGGGLSAVIGPSGPRWVFRYSSKVTGKRREAGLGVVSLKAAREAADALRARVRAGGDPLHDAEQAAQREREAEAERARQTERNAATLRACARDWHKVLVENGRQGKPKNAIRNVKAAKQWLDTVESLPASLLDKPIADIGVTDLLDVLRPIAEATPETGARLRQRLDATFRHAMRCEKADKNPAAALRDVVSTRPAVHHRALHYTQVADFVAAVRASERIGFAVRLCILFVVCTAARSGEARGARWSEIDLERKLWSLPASRMKAKRAHAVHLSAFALDVLREAAMLRDPNERDALVFPSLNDKRKPLSDMALTMALRRLETGAKRDDGTAQTYSDIATMHGFRSAFSGFGNRHLKVRPDVVERALAHVEGDTRGDYHREVYDVERVKLLNAWGRYIAAPAAVTAKVVPLRGKST